MFSRFSQLVHSFNQTENAGQVMWQSLSGKDVARVSQICSSQKNRLKPAQLPFDDTKMGA
jgi:hypothetical protein